MSLGDLQQMLAEALVQREPLARDAAWAARAERTLSGGPRMAPVEQLDVYREQFRWRHVACLAEDYPVLAAVIGVAAFEALALDYLDAHPTDDFLLRNLGTKLADFLAERRAGDPLLADLARLEWAFIDAFDAADAPPLDVASIGAIPDAAWPEARIELSPSLQRLRLAYPAHTMRDAFYGAPSETPARVAPSPTRLVVYRDARSLRLHQMSLDELPFALLGRLAAGEPLGKAADLAAETSRADEVQAHIGEWFAEWAARGWIARVSA